jgi:TorA maturation chaperone TorD
MSDTDQDKATAREDLCRFLAACYYEPTVEFAEEHMFDSMLAAAEQLGPELAAHTRRLGEAFAAAGPQELLVDYSRLFLGPVQAMARPYASVWLTGENVVMQDATMELLKLYEQGGFEIAEDFRELPDHVAVELEFLYLLTYQHNRAQAAGDTEALQAVQVLRAAFLVGQLGRWLGPFILAMHDGAQTDFYRELAELTELSVRLEGQQQETVTRH